MLVRVTDLCGREPPYEADLDDLDACDIVYQLALDNESPWFVGEYQYDEIEDGKFLQLEYCANCEGGGCTSCLPD